MFLCRIFEFEFGQVLNSNFDAQSWGPTLNDDVSPSWSPSSKDDFERWCLVPGFEALNGAADDAAQDKGYANKHHCYDGHFARRLYRGDQDVSFFVEKLYVGHNGLVLLGAGVNQRLYVGADQRVKNQNVSSHVEHFGHDVDDHMPDLKTYFEHHFEST